MTPPTGGPGTAAVMVLVVLGLLVAVVAYVWFAAAFASVLRKLEGEPWRAWVPVLNVAEVLERGGVPGWQVILLFVPVVDLYGYVLYVQAVHRIGRRFGRGAGTTVLGALLPPVWASVLGWSSAQPVADGTAVVARRDDVWGPGGPQLVEASAGVARDRYETPAGPVPAGAYARAVPAPAPGAAPAPPSAPAPSAPPSPWAPVPAPVAPAAATTPAPAPVASAPTAPPAVPPAPVVQPTVLLPTFSTAPAAQAPVVEPAPLPEVPPPAPVPAPLAETPTPAPAPLPAAPAPAPLAETPMPAPAPLPEPSRPQTGVAAPPPTPVAAAPEPPDLLPPLPAGPPFDDGDDEIDGTVMVQRDVPAPWTLVLDDGTELPLPGSSVLVGRRPTHTDPSVHVLALADPGRTVSKVHARLDLVDGSWLVTDLASTNGVHLVAPDGTQRRLTSHVATPVTGALVLGKLGMRLVAPGEAP